MKRYSSFFLMLLLITVFAFPASGKKPGSTTDTPEYIDLCTSYLKEPPFLSTSALPSTTLLVDFSGSLNEHAYQEEQVQWDNGTSNSTAYTGFNSTKEYYGYFDPRDYYIYNPASDVFTNATYPGDNTWNGNFLNWATMHRIDVMKIAMTGGKYENGTYTVSTTDGLDARGKYHIYNSTEEVIDLNNNATYVAPVGYRGLIGLEQGNSTSDLKVYTMTENVSNPDTFSQGAIIDTFTLSVTSEKEFGILDLIGPSTRLALFTFDQTSEDRDQGGEILHYMTGNATSIIDIINDTNPSEANSQSPLAEALYTIAGYISQDATSGDTGPRYNDDDSYVTGIDDKDPFYFPNATSGSIMPCTQQNIIIVSDGISTYDQNLPSDIKNSANYDKANNDATLTEKGSNYLDNVAYWAHTTDLRDDIDGDQVANIYAISVFSSNSSLLQAAAKWGGFKDFDQDGLLDENDWDNNGDGVPDNFFEVSSGSQLEQALAITMNAAINRVSSGGSASVVSTSRRGEGLLYQAVFWPELIDGNGDKITWAGDVYAYWLDNQGTLFEDDGDDSYGRLAADDNKITVWYDDSDASNKRTRACSGGTVIDGQCVNGTAKELTSVRHVWRSSEWLNSITTPTLNRPNSYSTGPDNKNLRYITTWVDDNNNGVIDSEEYGEFVTNNPKLSNYVDNATINWIRGQDQTGLRSRQVFIDTDYNNVADKYVTWRLGDVINSSPTIVAAPAENYHLYWKDTPYGQSYAKFLAKYKNRRIMVYFGANDGMFHAVNGGFYNQKNSAYYDSKALNGTLYNSDDALPIGAEKWAYVPYNLLPHLSCLTKENYQHQYYVDLKPRVFDAKVFDDTDPDHPGGWGTILVCGFNFGGDGQQSLMKEIGEEKHYFGSSYFIFDVTNPEKNPEFLGEMTFDGTLPFGFSINAPTLVATNDTSGLYWYLLFGNGPNFINGATDIAPTGLVLPLETLITDSEFSFRPTGSTDNPSTSEMGLIRFGKTLGGNNFKACISTGFVSIDYDFDFFVDMMYYGLVTTEGATATDRNGGMHRLKLDEKNFDPSKWAVMKMLPTDPPIVAAPNAAVKDVDGKTGSIWVYTGSGIYWDTAQKELSEPQWIYGVEEKRRDQSYDFAIRSEAKLLDVTNIEVLNDGNGTLRCADSTCNIPSGVTTVEELGDYIQNTPNIEGWKRQLATNERVLGQPTLFGGLTNFTSFTPSGDLCTAEGRSTLYALYYRTGTAWKENVFGTATGDTIPFTADLGQGMGITPSLHLGSEAGVKVYVQTSTGSIIEIHQPNLPIPGVKSGAGGWHTLEVD